METKIRKIQWEEKFVDSKLYDNSTIKSKDIEKPSQDSQLLDENVSVQLLLYIFYV